MKFCKDCRWAAYGSFVGATPRCARPGKLDPVTGDAGEYCGTERMGGWIWKPAAYLLDICGPQARFFEPKEAG